MASSTKQIIVCLTHNLKLYRSLQSALEDLAVLHATKIDEVSQAVKHQPVEAIIVHLANAAGKIILEMLKTGHGNIPRYAILSPSYSKEKDLTALAQEYEVVAATKEEDGLKSLASLIMARVSGVTRSAPPAQDFLEIYAGVGHELARLFQEYNVTGMRTLPQPNVGEDTKLKLQKVLLTLRGIKINP